MPPREKPYTAVILILDLGPRLISNNKKSESFRKNLLKCTSRLLQRKLIGESNDKFGLILCDIGGNSELNFVTKELKVVNWELIKFLGSKKLKAKMCSNDFQEKEKSSDWLKSVIGALEFLKDQTEGIKKCTNKKIVLMSDLFYGFYSSSFNEDQSQRFQALKMSLKKEKVEFNFIGPNSLWSKCQMISKLKIDELVHYTEGVSCDISMALNTFLKLERKLKRPMPWKIALEIGPKIKINTVGYIRTRREPPKTWQKCQKIADNIIQLEIWKQKQKELEKQRILGKEDDSNNTSDKIASNSELELQGPEEEVCINDELIEDTVFIRDNAEQEVIKKTEIITYGLKYGNETIRVDNIDEVIFKNKFDGGPKSMKVIGFVKMEKVPMSLMIGDGVMVFQPVKNDVGSIAGLSSLVRGMLELKTCALVRRVYRDGLNPKIGVLIPEENQDDIEEGELNLVYLELAYFEDVRNYEFEPLYDAKTKPNAKQLKAVDNLIDSMMLAQDGKNKKVLLQHEKTLNPTYQHMYKCIVQRATNPGAPVPNVSLNTMKIIQPPLKIQKSSRKAIKKIETLFHLKEIRKKPKKMTGSTLFANREMFKASPEKVAKTGSDCDKDDDSVDEEDDDVADDEDRKTVTVLKQEDESDVSDCAQVDLNSMKRKFCRKKEIQKKPKKNTGSISFANRDFSEMFKASPEKVAKTGSDNEKDEEEEGEEDEDISDNEDRKTVNVLKQEDESDVSDCAQVDLNSVKRKFYRQKEIKMKEEEEEEDSSDFERLASLYVDKKVKPKKKKKSKHLQKKGHISESAMDTSSSHEDTANSEEDVNIVPFDSDEDISDCTGT